jgi:Mg2+-importing ATPase
MTASVETMPRGAAARAAVTNGKADGEQARLFSEPLDTLFSETGSSQQGLSTGEAGVRLKRYGPNNLDDGRRSFLVLQFLGRFTNPLTLVLLAAAAISGFAGDITSFIIIVGIVFLSVTLDFVQEQRAGRAVEALRKRVALTVRAMRDGAPRDVAAADLVPGDVILLAAGDLVPADCRLVESRDLFVNEATLTGESFPGEKSAGAPFDAAQPVPADAAFMGSSIVSGSGRALVVRTGRSTQLGGIARSLRSEPPTAFSLGIRDFGLLIVRLTVLLVLFVLLVNLLFHRPLLESFLFALALAVGLTPELLPMVISVTLAHGAMRMAEKQVIVKRPSAIHDLGSMDVLCSDKTGTLTEAKIALVRQIDIEGKDSAEVLRLACLNAAFETGLKSPLDIAILDAAKPDIAQCRKLDEVPFDFERRRVSVLVEDGGTRMLVVKGAPEDVLALSSHYRRADGTLAPLDAAARAAAASAMAKMGTDGLRLLGVASRVAAKDQEHAQIGDECDLTFAGFAVFLDPPKESAKPALAALKGLGIAVKIITGDNEHIAAHVCEALDITVSGPLTGSELDSMTDEALAARAETVNLFCRITPMQKARIIRALRHRGHVVGYIGDGINDAPSINAADVGLSVDGAVDVAREAASMILLQRDLGVLAEGVREGRRTFANILKYVVMGTSSNFGNMFSMAGGVLFLPFLPMLPIQILLNNLLYDISEIAIPLDRVDDSLIARPHRWDMRFVRNVMIALGPVSSLFDFLTFALLLLVFHASAPLFHTGWFVESLATQVLVIFIIRTPGNAFSSRPHPALVASSLAVVALALVLPYTPLGHWLGFEPLPPLLLAALAATTAAYLGVVEAVKWLFRSRIAAI